MFKLIDEDQYQGHKYKLETKKVSPIPGYGFGVTIEVDGIRQDISFPTKANAYEAHRQGLSSVKQIIDRLSKSTK